MTNRNEYFLKLFDVPFEAASLNESMFQTRTIQKADASLLAELMIDAYRDTIDYDGETFDDALSEVNAFLAGERGGQAWLQMSFLAFSNSNLVGACLISEWQERRLPIIAYLMTSTSWKNHGIGRHLLFQALKEIKKGGYTEVRAVITEGNKPSENLFLKLGFQKVISPNR